MKDATAVVDYYKSILTENGVCFDVFLCVCFVLCLSLCVCVLCCCVRFV